MGDKFLLEFGDILAGAGLASAGIVQQTQPTEAERARSEIFGDGLFGYLRDYFDNRPPEQGEDKADSDKEEEETVQNVDLRDQDREYSDVIHEDQNEEAVDKAFAEELQERLYDRPKAGNLYSGQEIVASRIRGYGSQRFKQSQEEEAKQFHEQRQQAFIDANNPQQPVVAQEHQLVNENFNEHIEQALVNNRNSYAEFLYSIQQYLLTVKPEDVPKVLAYLNRIVKSVVRKNTPEQQELIEKYKEEAKQIPGNCRRYVYFNKEGVMKSFVLCTNKVVDNEFADGYL